MTKPRTHVLVERGRRRLAPGELGTVDLHSVGDNWYARARVRAADGSIKRPRAMGKTPEEAEANLRLKAESLWRGRFIPISKMSTMAELAIAWLNSIEDAGSAERETRTREQYESDTKHKIINRIGAVRLEDMTVAYINSFLASLRNEVSDSYAVIARKILSMIMKYAVEANAIAQNPMPNVRQIRRKDKKRKIALEPDQVDIILRLISEWDGRGGKGGPRPDKALLLDTVLIGLGTSLRPSEILGLRPQDVIFIGDTVKLDVNGAVSYTRGDGLIRKHRTKHEDQERTMTVPDFTAEVLRRRVAAYKPNRDEVLFTTRVGTTVTVTRLGSLMRQFREQHEDILRGIGVDPDQLTIKSFRKTVATAVARRMGIDAAASQLGHSDSRITSAFYIADEREVDAKIAQLIQDTFKLDFLRNREQREGDATD